jgi:hypothetical protein
MPDRRAAEPPSMYAQLEGNISSRESLLLEHAIHHSPFAHAKKHLTSWLTAKNPKAAYAFLNSKNATSTQITTKIMSNLALRVGDHRDELID